MEHFTSISTIIDRLNREAGDPQAFPRPTQAVIDCFLEVGLNARKHQPITTCEIAARRGLTSQAVCVALEKLAGLLALYGGSYILRRNLLPHDGRLYGYYIEPAQS